MNAKTYFFYLGAKFLFRSRFLFLDSSTSLRMTKKKSSAQLGASLGIFRNQFFKITFSENNNPIFLKSKNAERVQNNKSFSFIHITSMT